jgi:hypothetical protein
MTEDISKLKIILVISKTLGPKKSSLTLKVVSSF